MTDADRRRRNAVLMAQCWPAFRDRVGALLVAMEGHGERPRLQCAWRSVAEQERLWAAHRTKMHWGYHNATGAGGTPEALAVDVLDDDDPEGPTDTHFYRLLRHEAHAAGLENEISWDPYHVETGAVTILQAKAGRRPG